MKSNHADNQKLSGSNDRLLYLSMYFAPKERPTEQSPLALKVRDEAGALLGTLSRCLGQPHGPST
jgi:hypothetical protein